MAVERAAGGVVKDAFEEFAAVAIGAGVVDEDVVVHLLLLVVKIKTVGLYIAVLAVHAHLGVVADVSTVEGYGHRAERSTCAERGVGVVEESGLVVEVLHFVAFDRGVLVNEYFGHIVGESGRGVVGVIAKDECGLAVATHDYEVAHLEE